MLTFGTPAWGIIVRTVVIYLVLLIGLRLAGKREIGHMTVFDLIVLLLVANAVQNAMVGPDTSLVGGVLAAIVLISLNAVVARLSLRFPWLRRLVEGQPTLIVLHGKTISQNLRREGLDEETLAAALREHGLSEVSEVEMAVLETDGSISVIPAGGESRQIKRPLKFLNRR